MADAAQIADLLTRGIAGPQGPEDAAFHTGVIQSWDSVTGINVVTINGTDVPNVKNLQGGIPTIFKPGDVVVVIRKQTQYFVMGKIQVGGGTAGSSLRLSGVGGAATVLNTAGVWGDIAGAPSVTVYIGSTKTAIVIWEVNIHVYAGDPALPNTSNFYAHGEVGYEISGATSVPVATLASSTSMNRIAFSGYGPGQGIESMITATGCVVLGPNNNLNIGTHTFKLRYLTQNGSAEFSNHFLAVIPI